MRGARVIASCAVGAIVSLTALSAQAAWEPQWHRTPTFSIQSTAIDDTGRVYAAGFTGSPWAMVLAKYDQDGARRWIRTWRSHDEFYRQAIAHDVAVSPGGRDVYVVGATTDDTGENRRARVWAYGANGSLRWTWSPRTMSGELVAVTANDRSAIVASRLGELAQVDRNGVERWARPFLRVTGDVCQGATDIAIYGSLFVVGYLDRTPTCNDSEGGPILEDADVVLQRRTLTGRIVWSRIRTDAARMNDVATSVDVIRRGVFVVGESDTRGWLQRLTRSGATVWTRAWTTERPVEVSVSPSGAVYVLNDHEDGGTWLSLRAFSLTGALREGRRIGLAPDEVGSALATRRGILIVAARAFGGPSDIWRMPP